MVQEVVEVCKDVPAPASSFTHALVGISKIPGFRRLDLANPLESKDLQKLLDKWGMRSNMRWMCFGYDKAYHKMQGENFILDFLNDPTVRKEFQFLGRQRDWRQLEGQVQSIDWETVPASLTSTSFFNRLKESDPIVVRSGGELVQCMEGFVDGFQVSDMLRDLLLNEESENHDLFSESEQSELLFRILKHLSLGGSVNQFEMSLEPYLDAAKALYKALVSAHKNPDAGNVEVRSAAFALKSAAGTSGEVDLFPVESRNNFLYITFDPHRRICCCLYHAFTPFW